MYTHKEKLLNIVTFILPVNRFNTRIMPSFTKCYSICQKYQKRFEPRPDNTFILALNTIIVVRIMPLLVAGGFLGIIPPRNVNGETPVLLFKLLAFRA